MPSRIRPHSRHRRFTLSTIILVSSLAAPLSLAASHPDAQSLSLLTALARSGNNNAELQLGLAYEYGRYGLQTDTETGYRWLGRAAQQGNAYAADLVANHLAQQDAEQQAVYWWHQAAEHGNADAQRHLGEYLEQHHDHAAVAWLRKAAELGDHQAQQDLFILYRTTPIRDVDLHRDDNRFAVLAHRTHSTAGQLVETAWDVVRSSSTYEQSRELQLAHARQGDPNAEYELAVRYRDGAWDVNPDPQKAMVWLKRAAAAGNRLAQQDLSRIQAQSQQGHDVNSHGVLTHDPN